MTSTQTANVAIALIDLLTDYGVDTVFGIPGVHTLEFYRHLPNSALTHIATRHEQGAAFMADGYARASGKPGVALVISGPGVTNAATALGQAYADSIPLLLISTVNRLDSLGKGWGLLHELTDQDAVTSPMTAFSATARSVAEVPELLARAFTQFRSGRARPVHISIPLDLLEESVPEPWQVAPEPGLQALDTDLLDAMVTELGQAQSPLILIGGGAVAAGESLTAIAEQLQVPVISTANGKGVIPDLHPLHLAGTLGRPEVHRLIDSADRVLVVGSELAESGNCVKRMSLENKLLRIDVDPKKLDDKYPALVALCANARDACDYLNRKLAGIKPEVQNGAETVAAVRDAISNNLVPAEQRHIRVLQTLRTAIPTDSLIMADATQLVYTGMFGMTMAAPRLWHYPAGFLTLGSALPCAIGAQLALPDRPVAVFVGDGGFLFTVQELLTAAEQRLPIVIILWNNNCLKQIKDDMQAGMMQTLAVDNLNPEFSSLVQSCRCLWRQPGSHTELVEIVRQAFKADRPTVVEIDEFAAWIDE
ncbi:MAG: 5-guanidino-2-oxopentanoate decarboxylase [Gammaproteobacteria bacterium]